MIRTAAAILALARFLNLSAYGASTIHITEAFATDPGTRWTVYGETTRFQWSSADENLRVEWDSSKPKSFFYVPLERTLSRHDSFSFEFDLALTQIEDAPSWPLQIGIGFLNLSATNASWARGSWSPNVAEFNVYPAGYDAQIGTIEPTIMPSFLDSTGWGYLLSTAEFVMEFPTGQVVHVSMDYDAEFQALTAIWTTNGVVVGQPHRLIVGKEITLSATADYALNMFSISSYQGNPWGDSVLARGSVDNLSVTIPPPPPIVMLTGAFSGAEWTMSFRSRTDYTYTLLRGDELGSWTPLVENVPGTGAAMTLKDSQPPATKAFYRVRANQI